MTSSRIRLASNPLADSGDEQPTESCERCKGEGFVREWYFSMVEVRPMTCNCPDCGGSGERPYWQGAQRGE